MKKAISIDHAFNLFSRNKSGISDINSKLDSITLAGEAPAPLTPATPDFPTGVANFIKSVVTGMETPDDDYATEADIINIFKSL